MADEVEPPNRDYNPYLPFERQYVYAGQWFDDLGAGLLRLGEGGSAMASDLATGLNRNELDDTTRSIAETKIPFYDDQA